MEIQEKDEMMFNMINYILNNHYDVLLDYIFCFDVFKGKNTDDIANKLRNDIEIYHDMRYERDLTR
jgi:hypothetical protein